MPRKKKAAEEKETHVAIVLDESGSMSTIKSDVIGTFNEQRRVIKENAEKGGKTFVSLYTFNSERGVSATFRDQPAESLAELTNSTYRPNAYTPLLDAFGQCLSDLEVHDDTKKNIGFLVIVITDGIENASREWLGTKIPDKVKALEATGRWTIVLLGANVSLEQMSRTTGTQLVNTQAFIPNSAGVAAASASMSTGSQRYFENRGIGGQSLGGGAYWADEPDDPKESQIKAELAELDKLGKAAKERASRRSL